MVTSNTVFPIVLMNHMLCSEFISNRLVKILCSDDHHNYY
jgi:hypothetical protein